MDLQVRRECEERIAVRTEELRAELTQHQEAASKELLAVQQQAPGREFGLELVSGFYSNIRHHPCTSQADGKLMALEAQNTAFQKSLDAKDLKISQLAAASILLREMHASAIHELTAKHNEELVKCRQPAAEYAAEATVLRTQLACLLPEVRRAEHERRLHQIEAQEARASRRSRLPRSLLPALSHAQPRMLRRSVSHTYREASGCWNRL